MYGDSLNDCIYAYRYQPQEANDVDLSIVEAAFQDQLKSISIKLIIDALSNFRTINNRACSGGKSVVTVLGIPVRLARQVGPKDMTRNRLLALLHQKVFLSKEAQCKEFRSEFIQLLDESDLPFGCAEILPLVGGGFHFQYEFMKKRDMKAQFWLMCLALDYLNYVQKVRLTDANVLTIREYYRTMFHSTEGVFSSAIRHAGKVFSFVAKKYINGRAYDKIRYSQEKLDKMKIEEESMSMDELFKKRIQKERAAMALMDEY